MSIVVRHFTFPNLKTSLHKSQRRECPPPLLPWTILEPHTVKSWPCKTLLPQQLSEEFKSHWILALYLLQSNTSRADTSQATDSHAEQQEGLGVQGVACPRHR